MKKNKFNTRVLLYCVATVFSETLSIDICEQTSIYLASLANKYNKLDPFYKIYYSKYAMQLVQKLTEYLEDVILFELKEEVDPEDANSDAPVYDFCLITGKNKKNYVSIQHSTININHVIPNKLMNVCHLDKESSTAKAYNKSYNKINKAVYSKLRSYEKYSEVDPETIESLIYKPICDLVADTLSSNSKKLARQLYDHLFYETDRIVVQIFKTRFTVFDYSIRLADECDDFDIEYIPTNKLKISFNNGTVFVLTLSSGKGLVKEHLSVKFRTRFDNMYDLYGTKRASV